MSEKIGVKDAGKFHPLMLVGKESGTLCITEDYQFTIDGALANDPKLVYYFLITWAKEISQAEKRKSEPCKPPLTGTATSSGYCRTKTEAEVKLRRYKDTLLHVSAAKELIESEIAILQEKVNQQCSGESYTTSTAYAPDAVEGMKWVNVPVPEHETVKVTEIKATWANSAKPKQNWLRMAFSAAIAILPKLIKR